MLQVFEWLEKSSSSYTRLTDGILNNQFDMFLQSNSDKGLNDVHFTEKVNHIANSNTSSFKCASAIIVTLPNCSRCMGSS